jgi:hypothetical protein
MKSKFGRPIVNTTYTYFFPVFVSSAVVVVGFFLWQLNSFAHECGRS